MLEILVGKAAQRWPIGLTYQVKRLRVHSIFTCRGPIAGFFMRAAGWSCLQSYGCHRRKKVHGRCCRFNKLCENPTPAVARSTEAVESPLRQPPSVRACGENLCKIWREQEKLFA